jgi:tRNA A37 threonylcarbamoyladenosine modification protein TsaB
VLAAIDARRGEVFVAGWASAGEGVAGESFAGGGVARESFAPRALAPEDIGDLLSHERPALAVGDGAVRYRPSFEDLGIEVPPDTSPLHRVSGAAICELACPRKGALDIEPSTTATVLPNYLRRPDAEIALQGAAG